MTEKSSIKTREAARRSGLCMRKIRELCQEGTHFIVTSIGKKKPTYLIDEESFEKFRLGKKSQ